MSPARAVTAADERRRQFERDLHDGVQQQLVALVVNLQLLRRLVDSDPRAAKTLLGEIACDAQVALADVRELAWRIYPSLLPDRGLLDALREAASLSTVPTTIAAPVLDRFPAEIESTVYFCCVEALENVEPGQRATVALRQQEGALLFDLAVDGVGEEWVARVGAAIGDRLAAIDGTLTVEGASDAVRLSAAVPVYSLSAR